MEALSEKQKQLEQAMSFLDEGLKNHFSFEEKALAPLFGEVLMRALMLEHRNISKEIDQAKAIFADTKLEGLSREELLSQKSHIQQRVSHICQIVEQHASSEEVILKMIKRALEEKLL